MPLARCQRRTPAPPALSDRCGASSGGRLQGTRKGHSRALGDMDLMTHLPREGLREATEASATSDALCGQAGATRARARASAASGRADGSREASGTLGAAMIRDPVDARTTFEANARSLVHAFEHACTRCALHLQNVAALPPGEMRTVLLSAARDAVRDARRAMRERQALAGARGSSLVPSDSRAVRERCRSVRSGPPRAKPVARGLKDSRRPRRRGTFPLGGWGLRAKGDLGAGGCQQGAPELTDGIARWMLPVRLP